MRNFESLDYKIMFLERVERNSIVTKRRVFISGRPKSFFRFIRK